MSGHPASFLLDPALFTPGGKEIVRSGAFHATTFRYRSGVAGLRIGNGAGEIVVLPFQGQQLWDAQFHGRRLTMRSMFDEPLATRDYLRSYGALLIHCGGTAMGNPGPEDRHPLHGELPALPMDEAWLDIGSDEQGAYVDIRGEGRDALAFSHHFAVRPRLRLREAATVIEVDLTVENRAGTALAFMYLAHINFRPVDDSVLHDAVNDGGIVIRQLPPDESTTAAVRDYHARINADVASHRFIEAGVEILPELVLTMKAGAGPDGLTHMLQRHPDGAGDFVSYRTSELPYAIRWMTRGPNQDALGLVLPATAPPDGLAAARRKGQLLWIEPGACFRTQYGFGALDAGAAEQLAGRIAAQRRR